MKRLVLVMAGLVGGAGGASAQLSAHQPTERVLILPFQAAHADSALSIQISDLVRDRLAQVAKYKVAVVPKDKLCEALTASGFPCDGLLDEQQASQLARFLQVKAYLTGQLERRGTSLLARLRMMDIGSSGLAVSFVIEAGNPGTPQAVAEAIVQRLNTVVRASEHARECTELRQRSQFPRALTAARKALTIDPTSAGANLCMATVYEAMRMPLDSIIAASKRALSGDTLNAAAWENIARVYQQMGDTLRAVDAFIAQLDGTPRNTSKRLAVAQLLRQMKQYARAAELLHAGLAVIPGDPQMLDLRLQICIEGAQWPCVLETISHRVAADSSVLDDSLFVKTAIAAAEAVATPDTLLGYTRVGVRRFPNSVYFWKKHGAAFEKAAMPDSAVEAYKQAAIRDPRDEALVLAIAKAIVDGAVWDTAVVNRADSVTRGQLRTALATRVDGALEWVNRARQSADTAIRLNAYVIELTAVAKLAQAGASNRVLPWVEQLLADVAPRFPGDTVGPRMALRTQASFYFLGPALQKVVAEYRTMVQSKSCARAKDVYDQIQRLKTALPLARRVSAPYANQLAPTISQLDGAMPQVKESFKCRNF